MFFVCLFFFGRIFSVAVSVRPHFCFVSVLFYFIFFFILLIMKYFVKIFFAILQVKIIIFDMQVDND